jgi:D-cysteine desulfhydrase
MKRHSFLIAPFLIVSTVFAQTYQCNLADFMAITPEVANELNVNIVEKSLGDFPFSTNLPLYQQYPPLAEHLAHLELADLPTPVEQLEHFGSFLGIDNFYIKRDDLTGKNLDVDVRQYGGNKVRKLEFLLADAAVRGADSIVTFGCVGSNHATATAIYAHQLGFEPIVQLKHQPNAYGVRKNLFLMHQHGACMQFYPTLAERLVGTVQTFLRNALDDGKATYFIPTGGSCPLGAIGYVNAAFELKQQIDAGLMPEPDYIYVPAGSLGTISGLLLGAQAAGLKAQIIGVATEPTTPGHFENDIVVLFQKTNALLRSMDSSFPVCVLDKADVVVKHDFCGTSYGLFTREGMAARVLLQGLENILLDGTYTSKTVAALVHDAQEGKLKGKVVLYWHTYFHGDGAGVKSFNYTVLPKCLWKYFETEVQELDKTH